MQEVRVEGQAREDGTLLFLGFRQLEIALDGREEDGLGIPV